jgi:nicotinate-nucleotide adenylyltransferase
MKIGVFGGAFNPPHIGHVEAARAAASQLKLEMLIVMPTGTPPHKTLPPGTPEPELRLLMTKNAFCDVKNTLVSDMEIHSQGNNYTIDTINSVQKKYPGAELFLLVGTDMYNSLNTWKDSSNLLKAVTPALLPREKINISSTELRCMFPKRKGRGYVSPLNYSFIIKHRLYGAKPDWEWLRETAFSMLDSNRVPHVVACETEALRLAERWGVNPDDAREAAILHDITKKLDFSENMCIITEHGIDNGSYIIAEQKLLHSVTGALIAQSEFGVSDTVADAIKWHTTGKAGMTTLEKIIYIADYIESTRDFPGVGELRNKAYDNLNDAMIMGLELTVSDLITRGINPNSATLNALDELKTNTSFPK